MVFNIVLQTWPSKMNAFEMFSTPFSSRFKVFSVCSGFYETTDRTGVIITAT